MNLFSEAIRVENGEFNNLFLHSDRMNLTRKVYNLGTEVISLEKQLKIPPKCQNGRWKCRLEYDKKIQKIEFLPYKLRNIKTVKLVYDDLIKYPHKSVNRHRLQELAAYNGGADAVVIVKNGLVTDSPFSNVVFSQGSKFFTPDSPLLPGTARRHLLELGQIHERRITVDSIKEYDTLVFLNALLNLGELFVPVSSILY